MPLRLGPLNLHTPLDDARELWLTGLGGTACMTLYLTVGSAAFFEENLSDLFEDVEDEELRAMLPQLYENVAAFVCLYTLPDLLARGLLDRGGRDYGLRLGNVLGGGLTALLGSAVAWLVGSQAGAVAEVAAVYPRAEAATRRADLMALYQASRALYYFGWEYFFRGFLLHGLGRPLGFEAANLFQTMASVLMHIGCPRAELVGSLPYGLLAGGLSRGVGATWPLMVLHFVLGLATDLSCTATRRDNARRQEKNTIPLFGDKRKKSGAIQAV